MPHMQPSISGLESSTQIKSFGLTRRGLGRVHNSDLSDIQVYNFFPNIWGEQTESKQVLMQEASVLFCGFHQIKPHATLPCKK